LILRGHLSSRIKIQKTQLEIKSLTEFERNWIRWSDLDSEKRAIDYVLYSILSIDGVNILPLRGDSEKIAETRTLIKSWGKAVTEQILIHQAKIQRWYEFEMFNVTRFAYEDESDGLWVSLKDTDLNNVGVTGLPGTEYTGLAWHQIEWKYQSRQIELYHDMMQQMRVARFIVSPHVARKELDKYDNKTQEQHRERIEYICNMLEGKIEFGAEKSIKDLVEELHRQTDPGWEERLEWDEKLILEYEDNAVKQNIWNIFGSRLYALKKLERHGRKDYSLLNYRDVDIRYNREEWIKEIEQHIQRVNKSRIHPFDTNRISIPELLKRMEEVVEDRLGKEQMDEPADD